MKPLLLWGAAGHARVVADIVASRGEHRVAAFVDDLSPDAPASIDGVPVLRDRDSVLRLRDEENVTDVIVAFGNCGGRLDVAGWCREQGLSLATAIHPTAVISSSARIGAGTVVAAGAIVNPSAVVGENVILNTACSVDHDCIIGDGAHLSPGVHLGGWVRVGEGTWLGVGASVRDGITIGARSIIGVGAVVVRDIEGGVVAYGNPARVMRRVGGEVRR